MVANNISSIILMFFEAFGFKSGRDTDKLADFEGVAESQNGLKYLTEQSNAYVSGKIGAEGMGLFYLVLSLSMLATGHYSLMQQYSLQLHSSQC